MNIIIARCKVPNFIAEFLRWALEPDQPANKTPLIPYFCYRGHDCRDWPLLPKLCRDRTTLEVDILRQDEGDVVAEFRSRFGLRDRTDMEVMVYAQHYGAPTRLLDWSRNPFVGLWFAVSDKNYDECDGTVYQLIVCSRSKVICGVTEHPSKKFVAAGDFEGEGKHPIHVFVCPPLLERAERQGSIFSLANFRDNFAVRPLEDVLKSETPPKLRNFPVPHKRKPELRFILSELGLDAYSMYGGPDALGKSITARLYVPEPNESVRPPLGDHSKESGV
jgi:hypothetical protein